jgi:hypothetical protein
MKKAMARNVLLTVGTWSVAETLVWLLSFLLPLSGFTFRGDLGTVLRWVWLGVPHLLAAIIASNTLVWATDRQKPLSWILSLSALFLYSESMHAWRQLGRPRHEPHTVPDYIGIAIATIVPALTCLLIGIWWKKRLARKDFPIVDAPRSDC